ncbi:GyrI-like domain-containing protein [uncultured Sphaerochaeta sp.]|uniref:GyrI-like domain-containing protein n=1 Tax=uncultured Sphaerochaeta sp. TaxID=886478 RepID=UPI0029CA4984|nr:GyrI-like domain-containing protein [uncultured Sphaerochaeta sp.]
MGIGVGRKSLYKAKETPSMVIVPSVPYLIIDGEGNSNEEGYTLATQLLFSLHDLLCNRVGLVETPFLECVWTAQEIENREPWSWSAMIVEPQGMTDSLFTEVRDELAFKQGIPTLDIYRSNIEDGLCVTLLHTGPFSFEGKSFQMMEAYCKEQNLTRRGRSHREIYLDQPRKRRRDDLKTILRLPVREL